LNNTSIILFWEHKLLFQVVSKILELRWMNELIYHPWRLFVCFVVMLRSPKRQHPTPNPSSCTWYHWKALDEYKFTDVVS
jgi:hypothetical protein